MNKNYPRKPNTTCSRCSESIYRRPSEIKVGPVFCTSKCFGAAIRKEIPCLVCKDPILARLNKKTCSRACANKHRTGVIYKTGRPKDKVRASRLIKLSLIAERGSVCERCNYSKTEILHIHHRDRNPENNNPSNLEVICPNCHYEEHYLEKSWFGDTLGH